ncbi:hypothetical protein [Streptomyces rhizosphaericus]|uniref:hypothetical protein n=1 Tax=Streptomyces rhizosphaericus TaxID=114699 RepID=UPI000A38EF9B|nr:hypothetical protein [Streptomyces rhizosphaericus]
MSNANGYTRPHQWVQPERLAPLPEWAAAKMVECVMPFTEGDPNKAEEIVTRALAPVLLALRDLPLRDTSVGPYGRPLGEPMTEAAAYSCGWGYLTSFGDAVYCVLDDADWDAGEESAPGHAQPGKHMALLEGDTELPFHEGHPRAFHAPVWLGEKV